MPTHVHIPLFVAGVRTSTWAMLILFANLALYRRRLRPLIAGFVWLVGFEAAWLITLVALGRPSRLIEAPLLIGMIVVGCLAVWYARRRGLNVNLPLAAATAVVWLVWLGTGFHFNEHTTVGLNVTDEVLNETAKTLWALAYFVPLLRKPRWFRTSPALTALESCAIHGRGLEGQPFLNHHNLIESYFDDGHSVHDRAEASA